MKERFRKAENFLENHIYIQLGLSALLLTFIVETLNRMSPFDALRFAVLSPMAFLYNVLIILMTLSVSTLFGQRQHFAQAIIMLIWFVLGLVNAIVLRYRMTPFSAEDFNMIPFLLRIADNYLTVGGLIAIGAFLLMLGAGIVVLWKKLPKEHARRNWFVIAGKTCVFALGLYAALDMTTQTQAISEDFMNLADAYDSYGFAYCFTNSIVDIGIEKPEDYSEERIREIADGMRSVKTEKASDAVRPNIIMVQLESFFDPTLLEGFTYSEDPIPVFRSLKEHYTTGDFLVPVVGAGTANTEFEILTGMSTDFFGAGEYPYNTVLKDTTIESMARILGNEGYHTAVLHNNTGTFYHRNQVFSQMGFDQFVPEEYMYDLEHTPTNWAKDDVLTDVTLDIMRETDTPDFIYSITVESHGRYPETEILENPEITVSGEDVSANTAAVTYYVNAVHDVDRMIGRLVSELEALDEPTMLVLYGDHLPALGFEEDEIDQKDLYRTEYVIWDNLGLEKHDGDVESEKIGASLLATCRLTDGIMPLFHAAYDGSASYSENLCLLEYDMLYGEGYIFKEFAGELNLPAAAASDEEDQPLRAYEASSLKLGYLPVKVNGYGVKNGQLYVYGDNFNESSRIMLDDKAEDTVYIDSHTLVLNARFPKKSALVSVGQFDEKMELLGEKTNSVKLEA